MNYDYDAPRCTTTTMHYDVLRCTTMHYDALRCSITRMHYDSLRCSTTTMHYEALARPMIRPVNLGDGTTRGCSLGRWDDLSTWDPSTWSLATFCRPQIGGHVMFLVPIYCQRKQCCRVYVWQVRPRPKFDTAEPNSNN
jgi:hypothetical protein